MCYFLAINHLSPPVFCPVLPAQDFFKPVSLFSNQCAGLVKTGGLLVYSTCTYFLGLTASLLLLPCAQAL